MGDTVYCAHYDLVFGTELLSHTVCNCTTIVSLGYVDWYWSGAIHVLYRITFIIFTSWKSSISENVTYSFSFEILLSCCGTFVLLLLTRSPTPTRLQSRGGWYGFGCVEGGGLHGSDSLREWLTLPCTQHSDAYVHISVQTAILHHSELWTYPRTLD